jgi:hypothetical protein
MLTIKEISKKYPRRWNRQKLYYATKRGRLKKHQKVRNGRVVNFYKEAELVKA